MIVYRVKCVFFSTGLLNSYNRFPWYFLRYIFFLSFDFEKKANFSNELSKTIILSFWTESDKDINIFCTLKLCNVHFTNREHCF